MNAEEERTTHNADGEVLARQPNGYRKGQRVRVKLGPLAGLEGVILQSRRARLIISVDMANRSVSLEIDARWVMPAAKKPARESSLEIATRTIRLAG